MNAKCDFSAILGFHKGNFTPKAFVEAAKASKAALENFMNFGEYTDANGITYKSMSKHNIEGVIQLAAKVNTTHNPLMKLFKIPAKDAEEYFRHELLYEEDSYSEMSLVAMKDGKVIGFIINDDEYDEDKEENNEKEDETKQVYANKQLDEYAYAHEDLWLVIDEGMDLGANKEGETSYVGLLVVDPDHFKKGIAKTLFKISAALTFHMGFKFLNVVTESALAFEKLEEYGFVKMCKGERVSKFENEDGECPFEDVEEDFVATIQGIELK